MVESRFEDLNIRLINLEKQYNKLIEKLLEKELLTDKEKDEFSSSNIENPEAYPFEHKTE